MQIALDTSTSRPMLALLEGERAIYEWAGPGGTFHGETLLEGLDIGLRKIGKKLSDANLLSVGIGPGTFTGLRIGVVTAKFLADAIGAPVAPVSSLHAQALSALEIPGLAQSARIWSLTDARRQEVYALCLKACELSPALKYAQDLECALSPESLKAKLEPTDILLGEGSENYSTHWPEARLAPNAQRYLLARNIGLIGKEKLARGETQSAVEIEALYLKTEKF